MDLKKILGVCLTVLLVAGFSVQADAAVATPTGATVRVSQIDSAQWAAIGDSIIVEVFNDKGLGKRLDKVVVGIFDEDASFASLSNGSTVAQVVATNFSTALTSTLVSNLAAPTDSTGSPSAPRTRARRSRPSPSAWVTARHSVSTVSVRLSLRSSLMSGSIHLASWPPTMPLSPGSPTPASKRRPSSATKSRSTLLSRAALRTRQILPR